MRIINLLNTTALECQCFPSHSSLKPHAHNIHTVPFRNCLPTKKKRLKKTTEKSYTKHIKMYVCAGNKRTNALNQTNFYYTPKTYVKG